MVRLSLCWPSNLYKMVIFAAVIIRASRKSSVIRKRHILDKTAQYNDQVAFEMKRFNYFLNNLNFVSPVSTKKYILYTTRIYTHFLHVNIPKINMEPILTNAILAVHLVMKLYITCMCTLFIKIHNSQLIFFILIHTHTSFFTAPTIYTTFTKFNMKYLVMYNVYTDIGGIK